VRGSGTAKKYNLKESGNFTELNATILKDYNIELDQ
jgi:hypothetical protein